jgi:hypothetical protein
MLFEEEHSACEYVLSYGTQIEIIEPSALRELVVRAAEGIVAMYTRAHQRAILVESGSHAATEIERPDND